MIEVVGDQARHSDLPRPTGIFVLQRKIFASYRALQRAIEFKEQVFTLSTYVE